MVMKSICGIEELKFEVDLRWRMRMFDMVWDTKYWDTEQICGNRENRRR